MIKISRKEQQVLRNLKNLMAAEQSEFITLDMVANQPDQDSITELIQKDVLLPRQEQGWDITKDQLQIVDDDPEVEQAWEAFRAAQGNGSMTKLYDRNLKAEKASKHLEKVLFEKGRLTHMVSGSDHIWVTEDKVENWKKKGWREGFQAAVPESLQ